MNTFVKQLQEQRSTIWEQAKALLDNAAAAKRDLTATEQVSYDRMNEDLDALASRLKSMQDQEQRNADMDEAFRDLGIEQGRRQRARTIDEGVDAAFRHAINTNSRSPIDVSWERRSGVQPGIERRDLLTTSGGGLSPTSFWGTLERHLVEGSSVMAAGATLITTESGETLNIPKSTADSSASIITEGAAISESDPTLGSAPLSAYKYAFLVQISRELAEDSTFDVAGYLAAQAGDALANGAGAHFVTGTGTSQPSGVVTGSTVGVTGATTSASGAFTADELIDLYHSVAEPYARSRSAAFLMRNSTLAAVRKLKDTQDRYLFDVNAPAGTGASGTLLGRPVFVDPNVAEVATSAKSVLFGDFSKYWVRSVRGLRFERSDEYAFNADLITFRAIWRADGVLVDQTGAIKHYLGAAT